jgi:prepilin-type N-terminal cleavage/methylation domain-containing protein
MTPRRGFTLLEVLLVVAVMVILGAMAYPSIEAMYGDIRLSAAADQIRARWADARTKAIEEGRAYRFAVQEDGRFRIAPDAADFWSGGGNSGNSSGDGTDPDTDPDTPPLVAEESLPKGIVFGDETNNSDGTDSGPWTTIVRFLPTGAASADRTITLQATGYRSVQLKVRALTGAVSMETLAPGKGP